MIPKEPFDHRDFPTQTGLAVSNYQGTTAALASFGPCPTGFCWYIEQWSLTNLVNSSNNQELYITNTDQPDFIFKVGCVGQLLVGNNNAAGNLICPLYVPPGYWVHVALFGQTVSNSTGVSATLQRAWHRLPGSSQYGRLTAEELLRLQARESVNKQERKNAVIAGGWNG